MGTLFSTTADRLRSWHVVVAGLLVQTTLGVWGLLVGLRAPADSIGRIAGVLLGSVILFLAAIATVSLLPVLWMLYVGQYRRIAIAIMIVVGVAFLASLGGDVTVWPLPAFLAVAIVLAWRERVAETR